MLKFQMVSLGSISTVMIGSLIILIQRRLSGQVMTKNMIDYLEYIYSGNGNESIVIIAHSMGGLIALSAAQHRPDLVKGIVFCGTPFGLGGVPLVLWGIQRG